MNYIAFLRGINVGGKNIIKMADLRQMFVDMGMEDVSTHIQSGNILFFSEKEEIELIDEIAAAITKSFGIFASVILRSVSELKQIFQKIPFSEEEIAEATENAESEVLYLFMFAKNPSQSDIGRISAHKNGSDRYEIIERDMYVLFDKTILNSKLANVLQKTDIPVTSRNMKTIKNLIK